MKDKSIITIVALFGALVFLIIGFEGTCHELNKQREAYAELEQENAYLKFNGSEVQNCPLCGSENIGLGSVLNGCYVICKECHMQSSWCETVQEAVDAWNSLKKVDDM